MKFHFWTVRTLIDIDFSWIVHVREVNQQINFIGDK